MNMLYLRKYDHVNHATMEEHPMILYWFANESDSWMVMFAFSSKGFRDHAFKKMVDGDRQTYIETMAMGYNYQDWRHLDLSHLDPPNHLIDPQIPE